MAAIVVCTMLSVDGFTEGPGGDVSALPMDAAFAEHNADRLARADSLLFGGTTYRGMVTFWPGQEHTDNLESHLYVARRYAAGLPITVVSDSLTDDDTGPWREQTTIVRRGEAHAHVAALRERPGKDVLIYGSRTLWSDLLAHRLIDELHLMIGPRVVAGDARAFDGVPTTDLRLTDVRRWDGSDNVVLSYAVGGEPRLLGAY